VSIVSGLASLILIERRLQACVANQAEHEMGDQEEDQRCDGRGNEAPDAPLERLLRRQDDLVDW
jgi:hypothetical protein